MVPGGYWEYRGDHFAKHMTDITVTTMLYN